MKRGRWGCREAKLLQIQNMDYIKPQKLSHLKHQPSLQKKMILLLLFYRKIAFIQIRFILFQIKGIKKDLESLKELRNNREYNEYFSNLETHTHQHSQSQFANVRIFISPALAQMPFKSYWQHTAPYGNVPQQTCTRTQGHIPHLMASVTFPGGMNVAQTLTSNQCCKWLN